MCTASNPSSLISSRSRNCYECELVAESLRAVARTLGVPWLRICQDARSHKSVLTESRPQTRELGAVAGASQEGTQVTRPYSPRQTAREQCQYFMASRSRWRLELGSSLMTVSPSMLNQRPHRIQQATLVSDQFVHSIHYRHGSSYRPPVRRPS